jgi:hypothetical protein
MGRVFDGSTERLTLASAPASDEPLTLMIWFYADALARKAAHPLAISEAGDLSLLAPLAGESYLEDLIGMTDLTEVGDTTESGTEPPVDEFGGGGVAPAFVVMQRMRRCA